MKQRWCWGARINKFEGVTPPHQTASVRGSIGAWNTFLSWLSDSRHVMSFCLYMVFSRPSTSGAKVSAIALASILIILMTITAIMNTVKIVLIV